MKFCIMITTSSEYSGGNERKIYGLKCTCTLLFILYAKDMCCNINLY